MSEYSRAILSRVVVTAAPRAQCISRDGPAIWPCSRVESSEPDPPRASAWPNSAGHAVSSPSPRLPKASVGRLRRMLDARAGQRATTKVWVAPAGEPCCATAKQ